MTKKNQPNYQARFYALLDAVLLACSHPQRGEEVKNAMALALFDVSQGTGAAQLEKLPDAAVLDGIGYAMNLAQILAGSEEAD